MKSNQKELTTRASHLPYMKTHFLINVVKGDFLSRALDAEKESKEMFSMLNGTVCAKMSTMGENFLYQVSDGAEVLRSVVTPAGKLLMCWELKERTAEKDQVLKRSKRGFTYPGTLWCGAGNMADNYNQLGEFADTDSCCRTHDHCPHVIHAFSSKYGHTNFKWHSICHCDCDNALKACLRKVNDTSSRVVGQAFFNVIGVPCFEFTYEDQCAERHWYGLCKRYEKLPIAVLQESVPYDFGGIDVIDELTVAPPKTRDSKKSNKEEKPESSTQSTMAGPEEPSLRNVVTAAEDVIKVLATVSTSQSSTTEPDRGETLCFVLHSFSCLFLIPLNFFLNDFALLCGHFEPLFHPFVILLCCLRSFYILFGYYCGLVASRCGNFVMFCHNFLSVFGHLCTLCTHFASFCGHLCCMCLRLFYIVFWSFGISVVIFSLCDGTVSICVTLWYF
uniref:phospholipase A2 n=1 Tax=Amphiprion percula TaxID=161767 RepID=A0A3P8SQY3_AMPPE